MFVYLMFELNSTSVIVADIPSKLDSGVHFQFNFNLKFIINQNVTIHVHVTGININQSTLFAEGSKRTLLMQQVWWSRVDAKVRVNQAEDRTQGMLASRQSIPRR